MAKSRWNRKQCGVVNYTEFNKKCHSLVAGEGTVMLTSLFCNAYLLGPGSELGNGSSPVRPSV